MREYENAEAATLKLLEYCESHQWAGYEPYDALNSRILTSLPVVRSRFVRIAFTQALKRSPINVRELLGIGKTQNPKALALFLSAFVKLSKAGIGDQGPRIQEMIDRLTALRSTDTPYWCWGYSFPWQTRTVLVPRWAPNLVCTAFAGDALMDVYEKDGNPKHREMAVSAARFILNELYWTDEHSVAGFGYPLPSVRNQVHNANFLGASLLCRAYKHTRDETFLQSALRVARYSASRQHANGGWDYGEAASQRWIDNFHTGFNLSALRSIGRSLNTQEFEPAIARGLDFYRKYFFLENGAVRYYHNQTYPIDTHCIAQSIITLLDVKDLDPTNYEQALKVFTWGMRNMWDPRGFFYYRVLRTCKIRTSYMRWTQAWMLLALSMLAAESRSADEATAGVSRTESVSN